MKGRGKNKYGTPFKNHIIRTLLNGMSAHISDEVNIYIQKNHTYQHFLKTIYLFFFAFLDNDAKWMLNAMSIFHSERCCKYKKKNFK